MRPTLHLLTALVLILAVGCSSRPEEAPTPEPTAAEEVEGIAVSLDGALVATIPLSALGESAPLAAMLPESVPPVPEWRVLRGETDDGRVMLVRDIVPKHRGKLPELALRTDGQPVVWMRRPLDLNLPVSVRQTARQPSVTLVGVKRLEILTRQVERPAPPPAPTIQVRIQGKGTVELTQEQLASLEQHSDPAREKRDDWWTLQDLVALAAPEGEVEAVVVNGATGRAATFDGAVLPPTATQTILVKQNRKQELRLRAWKLGGERPEATEELVVTSIEVTLK